LHVNGSQPTIFGDFPFDKKFKKNTLAMRISYRTLPNISGTDMRGQETSKTWKRLSSFDALA
jgi:hypothetical protein